MPGKVVSRDEWLAARREFLVKEKEATKANDALAAELRELPMVKMDKDYTFEGPNGKVKLADLFEGRKQLIIYHFMLGPDDKAGCSGCSFLADNLPTSHAHINFRDTTLVLVSRAPLANINKFKERMGWKYPWYSSNGTDFNYDFKVTLDGSPPGYNFAEEAGANKGEMPGLSVFLKEDATIYHTYSAYARGLEQFLTTYRFLDVTNLGRQEPNNTEDWKLHDEY